jgi:hypothetical protein
MRHWWMEYGSRSVLTPVVIASVALGSAACGMGDDGESPPQSVETTTSGGSSGDVSPTPSGTATSPESSFSGAAIAATAGALETDARTRVFFGHQSVGMNVLSGVPHVFSAHGVAAPPIEEGTARPGPAGGFVVHAFIGKNEEPVSKIEDFDAKLRSGLGGQVNVAMMKFCYVDITHSTNVSSVFTRYRDTLRALERDFPKVKFIAVTVPLTTMRGGSEADNAAREQFNALLRGEYSGRRLFDLALVESTDPSGARVSGTYQSKQFFALYDGYAADEGHLNSKGSERVASAWLAAVAQAASG